MDETALKNLKNISNFLKLFLTTHVQQQLALLQTLSQDQVRGLAEIIFNLTQLPVSKKTKYLLGKRKIVINRIISKKVKDKRKADIIKKYNKYFNQILLSVKSQLETLL